MFDRNSSYNRRPNRSSSYEEDDFLDAQDQQERHSDRGARSRQSARSERDPHANSSNHSNFKQAAQSAFGSLTSLASRYVSFGDSGSAAGGNHTRQAASRSRHDNFEYQDEDVESRSSRSRNSERSYRSEYRSDRGERAYREERESRASRSHRSDRFGYSEHAGMRRPYEDERSSGYVRHNDSGASSRYRQPRHVALADASYRRRNSSSMRDSYGHALDYARHADNEERYKFDSDYPRRDHRSGRVGNHAYRNEDRYGGGYSGEERRGRHALYGNHDEYGSHYDEHYESRGRHSSPDIYVRSGNNRGIFNGGFSLPFGIGSSSRFGGGYYGGNRGGASILSSLPLPVAYAVPVVILVLIIVLLIFVVSSVQSCAAGGQDETVSVQEVQPMNISYQASISGIDSIADSGATITGFSLAGEGQNYVPTLSEEGQNSIQSALAPFLEEDYDVGFIMMDLETGSGYAYNPDVEVYGASSFKGPVLIYGCQESLEPGILSIDTVDEVSTNSIIYSDNNSYHSMRAYFEEYSETGLANWLSSMNIDSNLESDTSFPHYSARISAKLWMNTYLYFTSSDSDSEIVSWAQDLFSQTEVSMLRAGVDPTFPLVTDSGEVYLYQTDQSSQSTDQNNGTENPNDSQQGDQGNTANEQSESADQNSESTDQNNQGGSQDGQSTEGQSTEGQSADQSQGLSAADMADSSSNIVVYDKAGWIHGTNEDALCDSGIIYDGDKAYLLCIMTGVPDGDDARQQFTNLVAALWGQRSTLSPSQGYVLVDPTQASEQTDNSGNNSGN